MIISRSRIRNQSKVKSCLEMPLSSILLVIKEHSIDLKKVKVHLRVNTVLLGLTPDSSTLQALTPEFFVQLSNLSIIQRIILLLFNQKGVNRLSFNVNHKFPNKEFLEVKGKRNHLFKNKVSP
jgi:hypothetical protein